MPGHRLAEMPTTVTVWEDVVMMTSAWRMIVKGYPGPL